MLAGLLGGRVIQFLLGPAGKVLILGLAFGAWTLYHRIDATRDCEAAELREELLESQRQLEIAQRIADNARDRANKTEQEMSEVERLYDDLKTDLEQRETVGTCHIDPDLADRLRAIK